MLIRIHALLSILLLCIRCVAAETLSFPLYHQLLHSNSAKDITPRGTIKYDKSTNSATYEKQHNIIDPTSGKGIYRVTIYDPKKKSYGPWGFTKLDNAKGPVTEEITLYLSCDDTPYQISYALRPFASEEMVVRVVTDKSILNGPEPVLAAPVVVNPDGVEPVQEQEKTFLQKYWMYILPVAILLFTSGGAGGGEEQEGGRAQRQ